MPAIGGPGQQAIARAITAMPATRATGIATPTSCSPSNNCPTSEGAISKARPVAASPTAAMIRAPFILRARPPPFSRSAWPTLSLFRFRRLIRTEFERQPVDLAGELEGWIVTILQQRDAGTGIQPDVEGFIFREGDGSRMLHRVPGDFLAVHGQYA